MGSRTRVRRAAVRRAGARRGRRGDARALRRHDLGVVRRDDRRGERPARGRAAPRRHAQRPDLDDQHRRLGAYMWSALVAEELGLISHAEVVERLGKTITTLEQMERHESGQYFNWYDHRTG